MPLRPYQVDLENRVRQALKRSTLTAALHGLSVMR